MSELKAGDMVRFAGNPATSAPMRVLSVGECTDRRLIAVAHSDSPKDMGLYHPEELELVTRKVAPEVKLVRRACAGIADNVVKRGLTVEVKRAFFYRHGYSADKLADAVRAAMAQAFPSGGFKVTAREDWRSWPKTSYFVAIVTFDHLNAEAR